MKAIKVKQLEFYGNDTLELTVSKNGNVNLEITKLNGQGIIGIELEASQVKQLIKHLNKLFTGR